MSEMSRRKFLGLGVAAGGLVLGSRLAGAATTIVPKGAAKAGGAKRTVVVWSEGTAPKNLYPKDINGAIAEGLQTLAGWDVVVANLTDPEQGLPDSVLAKADVLIWWGHQKHGAVADALVEKVVKRVKEDGMGFLSLHSSHFAKTNKALMGTACSWGAYKGDAATLTFTIKDAKHPIALGLPAEFTIPHGERYSEPYAVPEPKAVVFDGFHTLKDGTKDPSRQIICWEVGKAKFMYMQAGHETNPVYFDPNIRKIMANAVKWAAPAAK